MQKRVRRIEHPVDRITRIYAGLGLEVKFKFDCLDGFYVRECKRGGHWFFLENPVTCLNTCSLCLKIGTPRKVHSRNGLYGWNRDGNSDFETPSKHILCTSCWNKVRSIVYRLQQATENRKFLNKLTRTISDERKDQNNRRAA